MTYRTWRRITRVILLFLLPLIATVTVSARDINLDEIYINTSSTLYTRLINMKTSSYSILDSNRIDDGIIFSGWISPSSIVYVKEFKEINRNIVYQYNIMDPKKRKIVEISGALIYTKLSKNGKYLICKSLAYNGNMNFDNKIVIVDLHNNKIHTKRSNTVFTDFTVSYYGNIIYYETPAGIVAYDPASDTENIFLKRRHYRTYVSPKNTTLCYVSPQENRILLLNGGGGTYSGIMLSDGRFDGRVSGITSAREIFWLNNSSIAYRSGYIGNYSVRTFNAGNKTYSTLLSRSLNTNLTDSTHSHHITYVHDGIMHYYNLDTSSQHSFLIEGEDAVLSPLGDYFCSLYNKTLYMTPLSSIRQKKTELRRNLSSVLDLYQEIQVNRTIQENEYSSEYITRKISVYKNIAR
ncbi:MAG: hypothetical protein ACOCWH_00900 [Spirochaetota bacterium]